MKWTDQSPDNALQAPDDAMASIAPRRTLCGSSENPPGGSSTCIVVAPDVHRLVLEHLSAHAVEQGGLLVGIPYRSADSQQPADTPAVVSILQAIPAPLTRATGYSLRMEAAVWANANDYLAQQPRAGQRIVGWYHSHPGLGAFFSSTDMKTQRAFFSHAYSVGWVIDPSDDSHAMFLGASSQPVDGFTAELSAQ